MEPYQFILTLFIAVVVIAVVMYKITHKSPRFRLIETIYDPKQPLYTPQVKIGGIWLNLRRSKYYFENKKIHLTFDYTEKFLDHEDALKLIDIFKENGDYTIHSNQKLNSNQKQIIVE